MNLTSEKVYVTLLRQYIYFDIKKCLFDINELVNSLRNWKMSEIWSWFTFPLKPMCPITLILVGVNSSIFLSRLNTGVQFTVLPLWRMTANVFDEFSQIFSDSVPSIADNFLFSWKLSCLPTAEQIVGPKHQTGCRCGVDWAHSLDLHSG